MEWSKLKHIILLLLILLNAFFFFLVINKGQQEEAAEDRVREGILSLLQQKGINVEQNTIPWESTIQTYSIVKDNEKEHKIAQTVLQTEEKRDFSSVTEYFGEGGTIHFYPDGRFDITLKEAWEPASHDVEGHAKNYLKRLGIEATLIQSEEGQSNQTVRFEQTFQDKPILNCEITMEYRKGDLVYMEGLWMTGTAKIDGRGEPTRTPATLLHSFVEKVQTNQISCSKINQITEGYRFFSSSLSEEVALSPVWNIETDAGNLTLNCITGEVERH